MIFLSAKYPYINYFVIRNTREESLAIFRSLRTHVYDTFNPQATGHSCNHSLNFYDESATIARPPLEPFSKKPLTDLTGYIVCMYRVFKGDDGEKFERNWLYWTGRLDPGLWTAGHFYLFRKWS